MAPMLMQGVPGVMGHQMQGMMGPQMQGVVMPGMQAGGSMMQAPQLMPAGQVGTWEAAFCVRCLLVCTNV